MKQTIKDIYNWKYIDNPETSLLKHINKVLNKTPEELSVDDICMLIRQEIFLEIAVPKAINLIKNDPTVGDYYDYCLLINLSKIGNSLKEYKTEIIDLLFKLNTSLDSFKFESSEDKDEIYKAIEDLNKKIL